MDSFEVVDSSQLAYYELFSQFEAISSLDKDHQLAVHQQSGGLILDDKPKTGLSSLFSKKSPHDSNWSRVASRINNLIDRTQALLDSPTSRLTPDQIGDLRRVMEQSTRKLEEMSQQAGSTTSVQRGCATLCQRVNSLIHPESQGKEDEDEQDWEVVETHTKTTHAPRNTSLSQEDFVAIAQEADVRLAEGWEDLDSMYVREDEPKDKPQQDTSLEDWEFVEPHRTITTTQKHIPIPTEREDFGTIAQEADARLAEGWEDFDSMYILKGPKDILQKEVSSIGHPLVDVEIAERFASELNSLSHLVVGNDDPERMIKLERLEAVLNQINIEPNNPEFSRKQALVSHLVLLALYPLELPNGKTYYPLSFEKILMCLSQIDKPLDPGVIDPMFFEQEDITPAQKLYLLCQMNLPPGLARNLSQTPLHHQMYHSPHLATFLFNQQVHVPQLYRQTCISTASNRYFQKRLPTIVEMVEVAHESINHVKERFEKLSPEEREAPAYQVNHGTPPTKGEYVQSLINEIDKDFIALYSKTEKALAKELKPEDVQKLSREWNFLMQNVAMVLDPERPKVYHYQHFPDSYKLSAMIGEVGGTLKGLTSGAPSRREYWKSIDRSDLSRLAGITLGLEGSRLIYRNQWQDLSAGPQLSELSIDQIWKEVSNRNGALIDEYSITTGGSGHTYYVEAGFVLLKGVHQKVFFLYDSMSSKAKVYTLTQFHQFLSEGERNGKSTNTMYTFGD